MDWVYAHNVLSNFSLRFWPQKSYAQKRCEEDPYLSAPSSEMAVSYQISAEDTLLSFDAILVDHWIFRLLDGIDEHYCEVKRHYVVN